MFRLPDHYLFKPAESLEGMLPVLLMTAFLIFLLFWQGLLIYIVSTVQKRRREWGRFSTFAKKHHLTQNEIGFLKKKLKLYPMPIPAQILIDPDQFEDWIQHLETKASVTDLSCIHSVRTKLFGRELQVKDTVHNTRDIPLGTELHMINFKFPTMPVIGRVLEMEPDGIVVIIHETEKYAHLIQVENDLEVTAFFLNHPPVVFMTWVKAAIPGPERMLVLEHSNFVITQRIAKADHKIIPPQYWHPHNPRLV